MVSYRQQGVEIPRSLLNAAWSLPNITDLLTCTLMYVMLLVAVHEELRCSVNVSVHLEHSMIFSCSPGNPCPSQFLALYLQPEVNKARVEHTPGYPGDLTGRSGTWQGLTGRSLGCSLWPCRDQMATFSLSAFFDPIGTPCYFSQVSFPSFPFPSLPSSLPPFDVPSHTLPFWRKSLVM